MLNLKFALNLNHLADEMMENIKTFWTSPFNAPVIIFPDPKLEQWFRLHWMEKYGTVAGLNTKMIDSFLMEILVDENEEKRKLNVEMLRNVILAYIYQHKDSLSDIDESGEVSRYLKNENNELDENRLFDFAGKMASLFLEYETSRPSNYKYKEDGSAPGILDCWKQGSPENPKENLRDFFASSAQNNVSDIRKSEIWQRNLYSKIFHIQGHEESLLSKVFQKVNDKRNVGKSVKKDIKFLTLPFLFEECKARGYFNCTKFLGTDGKPLPVFIFGLGGMGQFYRVILQAFSQEHDVYAYIQNPCMEFWEDLNSDRKKIHKWNRRQKQWLASINDKAEATESDEDIQRIVEKLSLNNFEENREEGINSNSENSLLCYWGKSGRDNIKLWCAASDYNFEFDEKNGELPDNPTLLQTVQHMVASRTNRSDVLLQKFEEECPKSGAFAHDETFSLTGAPTKIREMEILHSRICKLLQNGAHVNDILVCSPNLDEYRTAIYQAFDQNDYSKTSKTNLHVPFAIVDSPARSSLTGNALGDLFDILASGTITRPAFFDLVRNPVVQIARHFDNEEVDAWENWVENLNLYRDRNVLSEKNSEEFRYKEDWKDGVRRMLLSRFTNCNVEFDEDNELLPYSDIDSSNNRSLCKFVECIDDLEKMLNFKNETPAVTEDKLNDLAEYIGNFLAMQNPPDGFGGENIIYQNVAAAFDDLRCQYYAGAKGITWECLRATLCGTAQGTEYSCGNLFVNGITFCKFIPNRIIPVKHVFFIGADSSSFPGTKPSGMMDLRRAVPAWPGDDSPIAKNRYAFLCQFMSTSESFHISYVCKDIVKDEEFYPTSIVNDIRSFLKNSIQKSVEACQKNFEEWKEEGNHKSALKNIWPETEISLDENRPYSELFTNKEFRNKRMLEKDNCDKDSSTHYSELDTEINVVPPDRVSTSQLKNFLKDPFQFQIARMMQQDDVSEDDVDPEDVLFEPVDFNHLGHSTLVNKMVAANISEDAEQELQEFQRELELKGIYPDGEFKKKLQTEADKKCEKIKAQMEDPKTDDNISPLRNKGNWTYRKKRNDLTLKSADKEFTLTGTTDFWDGGKNLVSLTSSKPEAAKTIPYFKTSNYISSYLNALAIIAGENTSTKKTVNIAIYSSNKKACKPAIATVEATSEEAQSILIEIYALAFQQGYSKCVPVDLLDENIEDFSSFANMLDNSHGPWAYFGKKHLFDKKRDLGFNPDQFIIPSEQKDDSDEVFDEVKGEWYDAITQQKKLLQYLTIVKKSTSNKSKSEQ